MIRKITMPGEVIKGKSFPVGTIIYWLGNGCILACNNFRTQRRNPLHVTAYIPQRNNWVVGICKNDATEAMWDFYHCTKKKAKRDNNNYAKMMRHDRRHKGGGGGSRIFDSSITDYECAKEPLHDFHRVWQ